MSVSVQIIIHGMLDKMPQRGKGREGEGRGGVCVCVCVCMYVCVVRWVGTLAVEEAMAQAIM